MWVLHAQSAWHGGSVALYSPCLWHHSRLRTVQCILLTPDHISSLPVLFNVVSSLCLAVGSVVPVFRSSSVFFTVKCVLTNYVSDRKRAEDSPLPSSPGIFQTIILSYFLYSPFNDKNVDFFRVSFNSYFGTSVSLAAISFLF